MHGSHHLIVQSAHLKYEFDIKRNITIIKGDSATGKTTLVNIIRSNLFIMSCIGFMEMNLNQ